MFIHVTQVEYISGYILKLTFSDGRIKIVDLKDELYGPVFEPLRDPEIFKMVKRSEAGTTIEWSSGADFAPEFLYEIGRETEEQKVA
jgi:hypothetical protein